ncbi:MAG: rrmJ [Chloroflexi bacterium]|nr:rrmJ [Chloroflexota bacterium]
MKRMATIDTSPHTILAFCSPLYEDVALNELGTLVGARVLRKLSAGVFLLTVSHSPLDVQQRMLATPAVFTRQLLVDVETLPRSGLPPEDARAVLARPGVGSTPDMLVSDLAGRHPHDVVSLKQELTTASTPPTVRVDNGAEEDEARLPFAIVVAEEHIYVGRVVAGAGLPHAPAWPAGRPDFPFDPDLVSRSALKLLEALHLFDVNIRPAARALDLGAAPGGWSQVLAARGIEVTAVDPGLLDARVASRPNVSVYAGTAQSFLRQTDDRFDLIVNDMRLDSRESARILVDAVNVLRPQGVAIITLKLPEHAPTAILRQALEVLRRGFPVLQARCLYFNRNEVTVHARR